MPVSRSPATFRGMAWFRKEKKPRLPRRERLEIPPDAWEKCEACGHVDIREKFARNLNVCPECDYHRRIRAIEYVHLLLDEGTAEEHASDLRSTDALGFPEYPQRLKRATVNAGDADAMVAASGTLGGMPIALGVMDFAFMGGSMGSVVGLVRMETYGMWRSASCWSTRDALAICMSESTPSCIRAPPEAETRMSGCLRSNERCPRRPPWRRRRRRSRWRA